MVSPLTDDPALFAEDMLVGFCDLFPEHVRQVPGGVVAVAQDPGKVAVVVGGGSGHYPAFCGIVGPGLADGAVVGNVFTSPSTADAVSVTQACAGPAGAVLLTGNYAGDVMNFTMARDALTAAGIPTTFLVVTDDIASAPPQDMHLRRGIAGDLLVFKVAGAAAAEGLDQEQVVALARRANDATRSLGAAFDGCTMPGASEPLFTVSPGQIGLGVGIHGEPGIGEIPACSASELAALFVDKLVAEAPEGAGRRVAAVLNGLGRTKYEELFVMWTSVRRELAARGLEIVAPEVGELVTSLDMAGCSLTLMWLDDDLERLWTAPADTPAFRRGAVGRGVGAPGAVRPADPGAGLASEDGGVADLVSTGTGTGAGADDAVSPVPAFDATVGLAPTADDAPAAPADAAAQQTSEKVVAALDAVLATVTALEPELARLDAIAGDGDHGRGMLRGVTHAHSAALAACRAGAGGAQTLREAGQAWADKAGGTSGVLWGTGLVHAADALGDTPQADAVALAVSTWVETVMSLGKAQPGDKTMLDAAEPFRAALVEGLDTGLGLAEAWSAAAAVATSAAEATAGLVPKVGRARPLAERSRGVPDPGAVSCAAILRTLGGTPEGASSEGDL